MNDRGYFIIAQNNKEHDYIRMAYALALSIKFTQTDIKNVSIALPGTDEHLLKEKQKWVFDHIVNLPWGDDADTVNWKINNKWKYVHCTPYKETVILDADMLFLNDYSSWWSLLSKQSIVATTQVRTYRNEIASDNYYRKTFVSNKLPNIYTAFMYFQKNSEIIWEVTKLTQLIMYNWKEFYLKYLDVTRPTWLSADVAYALAIKLLGVEDQCTTNFVIPTFVHMKTRMQNVGALADENWIKFIPSYFSIDHPRSINLKIGNYKQYYPVHYHIKEWLTDNIIEQLEDVVNV
jgi:hypothetical protein|tara:strand:+ start:525 stop:1397 length:873 start_codon:yes stop_codon:yes gene_type:complete